MDVQEYSPINIGRAECSQTGNYTHIEDTDPKEVADQIVAFMWGRNRLNAKITINGIILKIRSGDADVLRKDIIRTIENKKNFLSRKDFLL